MGDHDITPRQFLDTDVYPRLTAERIFDSPAHHWRPPRGDKMTGGCPFHESRSGTSFVLDRSTFLWWCYSCHIGGSPVEYRARLRGLTIPVRGRDFLDVVAELARLAGVAWDARAP